MVRISRVAAAAAVSVLASVLAGCTPAANTTAPAAVDTTKEAAALKAIETAWNAEWKAKDNDKMVGHYTPDATLMVSGMPPMHGTEEIKKGYAALAGDPAFTITFAADKVDVATSGDLAATSGHYDQTATDPKTKKVMKESGSYTTVYRKGADGTWHAEFDINTPSGPDTPAS